MIRQVIASGLYIYNFHHRVLAKYMAPISIALSILTEAAEKEVQDTSCRGSGGVLQFNKVPQDWGIRGLMENVAAVSYIKQHFKGVDD